MSVVGALYGAACGVDAMRASGRQRTHVLLLSFSRNTGETGLTHDSD